VSALIAVVDPTMWMVWAESRVVTARRGRVRRVRVSVFMGV